MIWTAWYVEGIIHGCCMFNMAHHDKSAQVYGTLFLGTRMNNEWNRD